MAKLPQNIVQGLSTKSAKIRALDESGFARTEIAKFLEIRYQHVRNVLVQSGSEHQARVPKRPALERLPASDWHISRLQSAGFELLAECHANESQGFSYSLMAPSKPGVYVFAVDEHIAYVGLTRLGLRTRLGHYVYGHARQKTSARVKQLILEALAEGKLVQVLIACPPQLDWNGLPVDGAAGLETALISLIRPRWNVQGVR